MGCSPPDSWYEEQHRANIAKNRREHQERVNVLLRDVQEMSDKEKALLKQLLDN